MYLSQSSKVITIGDGDLSFSRALLQFIAPEQLIATTYDSEHTLRDKYTRHALDCLIEQGVKTFHDVDITCPESLKKLPLKSADIVIFNHPLVPTQRSYAQYQKERDKSANLLNRALLYHFLKHSFAHLLSQNGERLAFITTKSVKPYSHWHIETSLTQDTPYQFLGSHPFDIAKFKAYQVRNVDRDKCVKHSASDVYVYSDNLHHPINTQLQAFKYSAQGYCELCRKGPFTSDTDWQNHTHTRVHKAQSQYQTDWLDYLKQT